jgi:hypothetical protein
MEHKGVHMTPSLAPILSQMNPVHAFSPYNPKINVILSSHLRLGLPSGSFLQVLQSKFYTQFLMTPIRATFPGHSVPFKLTTSITRQNREILIGLYCGIWFRIKHRNHLHELGHFTPCFGSKYRVLWQWSFTVGYHYYLLIKLKIGFPSLLWSSWISLTCLIISENNFLYVYSFLGTRLQDRIIMWRQLTNY